jgi:hypothetical protein
LLTSVIMSISAYRPWIVRWAKVAVVAAFGGTAVSPLGDRVVIAQAPSQAAPNARAPAPVGGSASAPIGYLSGTVSIGTTEADDDKGATRSALAFSADFRGNLTPGTRFNLSVLRGPRPDLSALVRIGTLESFYRADITNRRWTLSLGQLMLPANPLAGQFARATGAMLQWKGRQLVAEVTVGKPRSGGEASGGHLIRTKTRYRTRVGTVAFTFSDLLRPDRSSRVSLFANASAAGEVLAETQRVHGTGVDRELAAGDLIRLAKLYQAANRVTGAGLEADLRFGGRQRLVIRAGDLWVSNAERQEVHGASGEVRYAFFTTMSSLSVRFQRTPGSVPSVNIPGNDLIFDGNHKLTPALNLSGRAYSRSAWMLGRAQASQSNGGAGGVEYVRPWGRVGVEFNYRVSEFVSTTLRRSVLSRFELPFKALLLRGEVELGETVSRLTSRQLSACRVELGWTKPTNAATIRLAYDDYGIGRPQLSADLAGSVRVGKTEWAGGLQTIRGDAFEAGPRAWGGVTLPLLKGTALVLGIEHQDWGNVTRWWGGAPGVQTKAWRATIMVRRGLTLPVPLSRRAIAAPTLPPGPVPATPQ